MEYCALSSADNSLPVCAFSTAIANILSVAGLEANSQTGHQFISIKIKIKPCPASALALIPRSTYYYRFDFSTAENLF